MSTSLLARACADVRKISPARLSPAWPLGGEQRGTRLGTFSCRTASRRHAPHVSAAPLPPLLPSPPANVPLPVYEALSLLGSTAGLLLIAWPLSWSDSEAPWARQMASTSVTGGGMFVVATGSSCFLAAVLLWMTDFVACDRTGTAFDCDRSLQSAQFLDPCKDERDEGGGFQRACPLDQEPATSVASTDAAQISIKEEPRRAQKESARKKRKPGRKLCKTQM